jgi:sigma-B regulation protein RsbU (phosphoserine phosphatase)
MRILVAEDDPVGRLTLAASLKALGHEPVLAVDGIEALTAYAKEPFRIVVSDWRMPRLDGLELCQHIRRQRAAYVYFILITNAESSDENHDAALAAGVDDFLVKPVVPRELKMRIRVAERILGFTAQVRQLEDFLPICGYCKKVRDDKNYWQQIESYINARSGTRFSHGVCPDCYERVVAPELKKLGLDQLDPGERK